MIHAYELKRSKIARVRDCIVSHDKGRYRRSGRANLVLPWLAVLSRGANGTIHHVPAVEEITALPSGGRWLGQGELGVSYGNNGLAVPLQTDSDIEEPLLVWTPSVTPSGLVRYIGTRYPFWKGDFFVGHLTDKSVERLRVKNGRVILHETILEDLEDRIRDIKIGSDDYMYVLTDGENARLLRLRPGTPRPEEASLVARKVSIQTLTSAYPGTDSLASLSDEDIRKGKEAFLERCAGCHGISEAIQSASPMGPDLGHVYGRLMGEKAGYDYSSAMKAGSLYWNFDELDRFLADSQGTVPGTRMAAQSVVDPKIRKNIIGFLKQQSAM